MLNLDTHIVLAAFADELSRSERKLLSSQPWSISAIVLWEIAKLVQLKRIAADKSHIEEYLSRIALWPIDLKVASQSTILDFKSDPADEIIAATSIVHHIPLVTRDKKILASKLVPFPKI